MADAPPSPPSADPAAAIPLLEATAGHLVELLAAKVELALLELEEEARRLQARLVLLAIMAFALGMGFVALNVAAVWAIVSAVGHGPLVVLASAGAYLVLALLGYLGSRHSALAFRPPLATTLEELRKDSRWLKGAR
jgi:uncharacterized membrane protein YqjE